MPRAVSQVYDVNGLVSEEAIPWDVASFREVLLLERKKREGAGITVGDIPICTLQDIASGIKDQKSEWANDLNEMRSRPSQATLVYTHPETGVPYMLTRDQVFRVGDCFAWYLSMCSVVYFSLYHAAETQDLDQLELAMRSVAVNDPWPQRQFPWVPE